MSNYTTVCYCSPMNTIIVLFALAVVTDIYCKVTWIDIYFKFGLTVYIEEFSFPVGSLDISDCANVIIDSTNKDEYFRSFLIQYSDRFKTYLFREELKPFSRRRIGYYKYSPLFHGIFEIQDDKIIVRAKPDLAVYFGIILVIFIIFGGRVQQFLSDFSENVESFFFSLGFIALLFFFEFIAIRG